MDQKTREVYLGWSQHLEIQSRVTQPLSWNQRELIGNSVRSVTLGDENTNFSYHGHYISQKKLYFSLTNSKGSIVIDHDQKANLLWSSFKQRLGVSEFSSMAFNLSSLLTEHNLEVLDAYFSQEEIDMVIKNLPNSHAPGPDGFNGLFIKKCWNITKEDFTKLFSDFNSHNIDLRSINSSVIAWF